MADLTTKQRDDLPKKDFGLPSQDKYPMPDKGHAMEAKARAREMLNRGALSSSEYGRIVTKADAILQTK